MCACLFPLLIVCIVIYEVLCSSSSSGDVWSHIYSKSMDQPGKVASPARGQLNRKNEYFPVRVRSCLRIWSRETSSAVPSRVILLISILRLNLVLTYEVPPEFRRGIHLFIYNNRHTCEVMMIHKISEPTRRCICLSYCSIILIAATRFICKLHHLTSFECVRVSCPFVQ